MKILVDIFKLYFPPFTVNRRSVKVRCGNYNIPPSFLPLFFTDFSASGKNTYCETGKKLKFWQFINFKTKKRKYEKA